MDAKFPCPFTLLLERLENEAWLGEVLLFPDQSRLASTRAQLRSAVETNGVAQARELAPVDFFRHITPEPPTVAELLLRLNPPKSKERWRDPVDLRFHAVKWSPGPRHHLAWVPALALMVQSRKIEELDAHLEEEIRAFLLRTGAGVSLRRLTFMQRIESVEVMQSTLGVEVKAPKERALEQRQGSAVSVLREVATELGSGLRPAYEVEVTVEHVAALLKPPSPRSVLLVGDSGTGKTACLHQLVRDRHALGLDGYHFWATSGARLVAGAGGFGEWEDRLVRLLHEVKGKRIVLALGNLLELTRVGRSDGHAYGVASLFRPAMVRGEVLVVAECTPEQRDMLRRDDPALIDAVVELRIEEPDMPAMGRILKAVDTQHQATPDALDAMLRLHRRYATYSAWPGRIIRFLRGLSSVDTAPITPDTVIRTFSSESGLPLVLLDPTLPMGREATLQWFLSRVMEQDEAVMAVVDLLLVIKATLHRPRRPLASFLFLGPTGVGKTELARTLSEYLFSDRQRMVRFDMSEYSSPAGVERLMGLLVARVREQPFCVLLFDEFEKADALFFDLLLQVLGDGRLTDSGGRLADFRNAVIIMTSNLGAQEYLQGDTGFLQDRDVAGRTRHHFVQAVQSFLRPELYNRIDRVMPFAPLSRDGAARIVRRELDLMRQRDGIKYRNLTLHLDETLVPWIVEHSFDRRYGARTLRRFLEQNVLVPLADTLNAHDSRKPVTARFGVVDGQLRLESTVGPRAATSETPWYGLATEVRKLRRSMQALQRCSLVITLVNQLARLRQVKKRAGRTRRSPEEEARMLARRQHLEQLTAALEGTGDAIQQAEDQVLTALYQDVSATQRPSIADLTSDFRQLVFRVYAEQGPDASHACVGVYGESSRFRTMLAQAFVVACLQSETTIEVLPLNLLDAGGWSAFLHARKPDANQIGILKALRQWRDVGLAEAKAMLDSLPLTEPPPTSKPIPILLRDDLSKDQANSLVSDMAKIGALVTTVETGAKTVAGDPVEADSFLTHPPVAAVGWLIAVRGPLAGPRISSEAGLHLFIERAQRQSCVVDTFMGRRENYVAPADAHRRSFVDGKPKRRTYDLTDGEMTEGTSKTLWRGDLGPALRKILDERLWLQAVAMLDES